MTDHARLQDETQERRKGSAVGKAKDRLRKIGALFAQRGWSLGTSCNYSIVLDRDPFRLLLTASGKDKRRLTRNDFVLLDGQGTQLDNSGQQPSAEAGLHLLLARLPEVGCVLHTHSVWGTLLSDLYGDAGGFWIEGYEMLKGLRGITTHETRHWVPVVPNNQDIPALVRSVGAVTHGFLIRKHGLYTWGRDLDEALRHLEIHEFLFEVVARRLAFPAGGLTHSSL